MTAIRKWQHYGIFAIALLGPLQAAWADDRIVDELRLGGSASVQSGHSQEDGGFIDGTLFLDPLGHNESQGLQKLLRPRIHVGTSISTSHEANQVFGGFSWGVDFNDKIFAEAGFGGLWHDGQLTNNPDGLNLGCHVLFHEYVGAGYRLDEHWNVFTQINHSSHAKLCDGPNDGMTRAGIQVGYKF